MGKRPKQTFPSRGHIDGQLTKGSERGVGEVQYH